MSLFKRGEPKPKMGDYRVVRVTLRNGSTRYEVQRYGWGMVDSRGWQYVACFPTLPQAEDHILTLQGGETLSREVVWP